MKLSELIAKVGDDAVKFQPLDECLLRANFDHAKGTTITFGTRQKLLPNGTEEYGMVVWLPRDKLKAVIGK